jgi:uncharacterized protein
MNEQFIPQSLRSDCMELILLPTEQCNFRCVYCYETFEHRKMPPSVVAGVKALIDRRSSFLNELAISWFGGEPLLAFGIVKDVCDYAIHTAEQFGFIFSSNITTNGYLLDRDRFLQCLQHRIGSFQISLDGDQETHDKSRLSRTGSGTFDRIWANVIAMKDIPGDWHVLLRMHYRLENYEEIAQFAKKVNDTFGSDNRFRYLFKKVGRLGGANDGNIALVDPRQTKEIEAYLWHTSGLPCPAENSDSYVCYAAVANSLVVRSTGRLGKCTVALNDDYNDIGWLKENGEIVADQEKFQRWIAPVIEGRWDDAECPLASVAKEAQAGRPRTPAGGRP